MIRARVARPRNDWSTMRVAGHAHTREIRVIPACNRPATCWTVRIWTGYILKGQLALYDIYIVYNAVRNYPKHAIWALAETMRTRLSLMHAKLKLFRGKNRPDTWFVATPAHTHSLSEAIGRPITCLLAIALSHFLQVPLWVEGCISLQRRSPNVCCYFPILASHLHILLANTYHASEPQSKSPTS